MTMYFVDVKDKTKACKKKICDALINKYGLRVMHPIWEYPNAIIFVWVDGDTNGWQHLDNKRLYSADYVPSNSVYIPCPYSVNKLGEM